MEATDQRFAYRCLPLNIANASGWEILCPSASKAAWDGGKGIESIQVRAEGEAPAPAISHFMQGILTFHVRCLFRTEPGYDLMVQGPINRPKDGIAALCGVIETDWSPLPFTMNWMFTRPGIAGKGPFHRIQKSFFGRALGEKVFGSVSHGLYRSGNVAVSGEKDHSHRVIAFAQNTL